MKNSWQIIMVITSSDFTAIKKMRDDGEALIVSENLDGVLRYINSQSETYHIYEISPENIRGFSLNENIENNIDGAKQYLETTVLENKNIDWDYETNGAIHLNEAHVYPEDVTMDKIKYLGNNLDNKFKHKIDNLQAGDWKNSI